MYDARTGMVHLKLRGTMDTFVRCCTSGNCGCCLETRLLSFAVLVLIFSRVNGFAAFDTAALINGFGQFIYVARLKSRTP
jgi:hypothetical protein